MHTSPDRFNARSPVEEQAIALEDILNGARILPHYQPILSVRDQAIYGYEALMRGPVDSCLHSPLALLDAAARHGRLADLERLAQRSSILGAARQGLPGRLFLNVSPAILLDRGLDRERVLAFLDQAGIAPEQLVIEITEQHPVHDFQAMRNAVTDLREMGFAIAIDDLGAGYAGLRQWSELRPDYVKIDRHFIRDVHEDAFKRQFIHSTGLHRLRGEGTGQTGEGECAVHRPPHHRCRPDRRGTRENSHHADDGGGIASPPRTGASGPPVYHRVMRAIRLLLLLYAVPATHMAAEAPLVDAHTHYKWSQTELTSPQQALDILRTHGISRAVVIGTPAEYALRLRRLDPERIVALWSPYRVPGEWSRWAFDPETPGRARTALASGDYQGIGELHLIGGFVPRADSAVISDLLALAEEFEVPILLHTEFSANRYLLDLCRAHPEARIVWAHAGAILPPAAVREVLQQCANVVAELSARDPWRFVNNPITDEQGLLLPEWKRLIEDYPLRFMIGSDPVWPVEKLDGWDRADSGWQEYGRFMDFHRGWLRQLGPATAVRVGHDNALQVYRPAPLSP